MTAKAIKTALNETKTVKPPAGKKKSRKPKPIKKEGVAFESETAKQTEPVETVKEENLNDVAGIEDEAKETRVEKYYESVGRRKEATARVRVFTKKSTDVQQFENKAIITVNNKPYYEYFKPSYLQDVVDAPLKKLKSLNRFKATVKIKGGGLHGQADAVKFGLSRALVLFDSNFSKKLRKAGYLTRDSREKERRKYGLKKARKAPQWAKR